MVTLFLAGAERRMQFVDAFVVAGWLHDGAVVVVHHEDFDGPFAHGKAGLGGWFGALGELVGAAWGSWGKGAVHGVLVGFDSDGAFDLVVVVVVSWVEEGGRMAGGGLLRAWLLYDVIFLQDREIYEAKEYGGRYGRRKI